MIPVISVILYFLILFFSSYHLFIRLFRDLNEGKPFRKTVGKYSIPLVACYTVAVLILWFGY